MLDLDLIELLYNMIVDEIFSQQRCIVHNSVDCRDLIKFGISLDFHQLVIAMDGAGNAFESAV